jgi:hypothetical protein
MAVEQVFGGLVTEALRDETDVGVNRRAKTDHATEVM